MILTDNDTACSPHVFNFSLSKGQENKCKIEMLLLNHAIYVVNCENVNFSLWKSQKILQKMTLQEQWSVRCQSYCTLQFQLQHKVKIKISYLHLGIMFVDPVVRQYDFAFALLSNFPKKTNHTCWACTWASPVCMSDTALLPYHYNQLYIPPKSLKKMHFGCHTAFYTHLLASRRNVSPCMLFVGDTWYWLAGHVLSTA